MIANAAMHTASYVRFRVVLALLLAAMMLAAVLAGLFARWHELGTRPLAVDEYYTVRSVEFVLERGVPEFPTGGYYTRGLPFQYVLAASTKIFGENAFAYRLPGFVFSLISVALAYWYARRFTGVPVATAVAAALLVSSWHIEFAHFVRMYALFQCLTLLFLIAADDAFFGAGWRRRYLPHALVVVATLTHQLGVLLTPLLFLPLIANSSRISIWHLGQRLRFAAVGLLTTLACLILIRFSLPGRDVIDPFPTGYGPVARSAVTPPAFPFWRLDGDPWATLIIVFVLVAIVVGGLWLLKQQGRAISEVDLWLGALIVFSAAHLFVPAGLVLLVLLLRYDLYRTARHPKRAYLLLLGAGLFAALWSTLALISPATLANSEIQGRWDLGEVGYLKAVWTTLFGWPDLYKWTVRPFVVELPVLGLLTLGALVYTVCAHRHDPLPALLRHPGLVIVMTMLIYGLAQAPYSNLRYWYHLYPVILCLIALAVEELVTRLSRLRFPSLQRSERYLSALVFLGIFALTSDFNPRHVMQVANDAVVFRTGPFEPFWATWYQRLDYESPARFVNRNVARADSARIIVEYHYPTSYYLQPEHAIWLPRHTEVFDLHSRVRGTVDKWSDRRLLSTEQDVADYTRTAADVWIIRGTDLKYSWEAPDPARIWGDRLIEQSRSFVSRDGRIEVVHVSLAPPTDQDVVRKPAAQAQPAAPSPQDAAAP